MALSGECKLLKIYLTEDTKYKSHNMVQALVSKFKETNISGVTVTRGILGYGQGKKIHTIKVLELSSSLPIILEVVDTVENIEKAILIAKEMIHDGLIITCDVQIIKNGN